MIAITTIIAITRKIPNPIPALKIPVIALHDENNIEISSKENITDSLEFFIFFLILKLLFNDFTRIPTGVSNKKICHEF